MILRVLSARSTPAYPRITRTISTPQRTLSCHDHGAVWAGGAVTTICGGGCGVASGVVEADWLALSAPAEDLPAGWPSTWAEVAAADRTTEIMSARNACRLNIKR